MAALLMNWGDTMKLTVLGAAVAAMVATGALAQAPNIVTEEMMVPSSDPGIQIYVRNKRPANMNSFRPVRTLLSPNVDAV